MNQRYAITALTVLLSCASLATAQTPKEGKISSNTVFVGSSIVLPMAKERLQISYEGTVLTLASSKDFDHYSTMWCVGALQAVNGKFDNDSGLCQTTLADGDKAFTTYKAAGGIGKAR